MTNRPSVRALQRRQQDFPDWVICPVCLGGRGEVIPVYEPETGEHIDYAVQECQVCHGEGVIPRPVVPVG